MIENNNIIADMVNARYNKHLALNIIGQITWIKAYESYSEKIRVSWF